MEKKHIDITQLQKVLKSDSVFSTTYDLESFPFLVWNADGSQLLYTSSSALSLGMSLTDTATKAVRYPVLQEHLHRLASEMASFKGVRFERLPFDPDQDAASATCICHMLTLSGDEKVLVTVILDGMPKNNQYQTVVPAVLQPSQLSFASATPDENVSLSEEPLTTSSLLPAPLPHEPSQNSPKKTLRFLWKMDKNGYFTYLSEDIRAEPSLLHTDLVGQHWRDLVSHIRETTEGALEAALSSETSWQGIQILWPLKTHANTYESFFVPVEFSAVPSFRNDGAFEGYSGFALCRLQDQRSLPQPTQTEPSILLPYETEVSDATSYAETDLFPVHPAETASPELSASERLTFQEIARTLMERSESSSLPLPAPSEKNKLPTIHDTSEQVENVSIQISETELPDFTHDIAEDNEHSVLFDVHINGCDLKTDITSPPASEIHYDADNEKVSDLAPQPSLFNFEAFSDDEILDEETLELLEDSFLKIDESTDTYDESVLDDEDLQTYTTEILPSEELQPISESALNQTAVSAPVNDSYNHLQRIHELESVLDTAADGVVILNAKGTILSLNRSAEALFGYEQHEIQGESVTALLATESHIAILDYLEGLMAGGIYSLLNGREVLGRVKQGGTIPLFLTMGTISDGPEQKFCMVLRDMTSFKKAESELLRAKQAAEQASAHKSDFLAKISHDVRTPMNAIVGFTELMLEERFGPVGNPRYLEYLKDVRDSGNYVVSLINDLLDLAKIEAGKIELSFVRTNLNDLVARCISLLQNEASKAQVILRLSYSAKLPPIVADERSLQQIILNLLSNAIKYTETGGQIIVSTCLTDFGEAVLRVRDNGIGMKEDEIRAAFEPFRQLSTTHSKRGSGLGLSVTKALVEANRGLLHISSSPGQGTLAEVLFPPTRVLAE